MRSESRAGNGTTGAATAKVGVDRWAPGEVEGDPLAIASFVARWNLRGLGVAGKEIDQALALAARVVVAEEVPAPTSTRD